MDISLNRCAAESEGFLPEKFKLGNPTPGNENDCSGPHFILEDHILDVIDPVNTQSPYIDDFDDLDGASCSNSYTSSIEQIEYNRVNSTFTKQAVSRANDTVRRDVCLDSMANPDGGNIGMEIEQENHRKRHISDENGYSEKLEWKITSHFQARWIEQIKSHQSNLISIEAVESNKVWFDYLYNDTHPKESTYRCRICHQYYDEFKLQQRYKTTFAEEQGSLRAYKADNKKAIMEHSKSSSHTTIIQLLEQKRAKRLLSYH